jgi:epoxyqueuosine reductase
MSLRALAVAGAVKARARDLGFDAVAIGPADPPPHARQFEWWLDAGYAGSMAYLERTRAERLDPDRLLRGCRSIVAVALSYKPEGDGAGRDGAGEHGPSTGHDDAWRLVARYARGRDYHEVMRPRLERLAGFIGDVAGPDVVSRAVVDTSAVLERDLAARAGLGWIGRNTNLLSGALGSYFFIGIVLTTAALDVDGPVADRCGTCRACLDACPTSAFVAPYVLDARRCLSYLTIEHRGDVDGDLRSSITDWIFGCDVCQEVCPWNRKAAASREPAFASSDRLGPLQALLGLDEGAFRARFRGSALMRAKRSGLLRSVALALGNRGEVGAVPALRAGLADADPVVREAVAWALGRLDAVAPGHASGTFDRGLENESGGA